MPNVELYYLLELISISCIYISEKSPGISGAKPINFSNEKDKGSQKFIVSLRM